MVESSMNMPQGLKLPEYTLILASKTIPIPTASVTGQVEIIRQCMYL